MLQEAAIHELLPLILTRPLSARAFVEQAHNTDKLIHCTCMLVSPQLLEYFQNNVAKFLPRRMSAKQSPTNEFGSGRDVLATFLMLAASTRLQHLDDITCTGSNCRL